MFKILFFSDFLLYGPWEAGNVCKVLLADVGTFPDIGKLILSTCVVFPADEVETVLQHGRLHH